MTVTNTSNKIVYPGDGAATVFPFTFIGVDGSDIQVTYTSAAGVATLLPANQYTLVLNPATGTSPFGAGGSVTYAPLGVPIAIGTSLTIARVLPIVQGTSLANQGASYPKVIEAALDYLTMALQQLYDIQARAITVPISDPTPPSLPPAAQRANQALIFDANGNPTAGALPAGGFISAPMAPVVGAASLALGRTAFGLGNIAVENIGSGLEDNGSGSLRANFLPIGIVAPAVLTAANHLERFVIAAPTTVTLPRANTTFAGFGFWISTFAGACTLIINANDSIAGVALGQSFILPQGAAVYVTTNAATNGTWFLDLITPTISDSGGRLSLLSGAPVITADAGGSVVFWVPYRSNIIQSYNGSTFTPFPSGELQLALTVGNHPANGIHDVFATFQGNALILVTGPGWTNSGAGTSARGSGAGTSQLVAVNGVYTNAVQMTNAANGSSTYVVPANTGTYLGTILISATAGVVVCNLSYGQSKQWGVWNNYNRVNTVVKAGNAAGFNVTQTGVTPWAGNAANSFKIVQGLAEDPVSIEANLVVATPAANPNLSSGIGWNAVGAFSGPFGIISSGAGSFSGTARGVYEPGPVLGMNLATGLLSQGGAMTSVVGGGEPTNCIIGRFRA